jgi:integrase
VIPWSSAEAKRFLEAAAHNPLYPAYVLLLLYGMRRGEVLGLRWGDVDFDTDQLRVRQQIQRIQGELYIGPVKTRAGNRDVPLIGLARDALLARRRVQDSDRAQLGRSWIDAGLISTTRTGRPVEPRNFVRSFASICDANGIRRIRVHAIRHTTASLLKDLQVPARDAQIILVMRTSSRHSRSTPTLTR